MSSVAAATPGVVARPVFGTAGKKDKEKTEGVTVTETGADVPVATAAADYSGPQYKKSFPGIKDALDYGDYYIPKENIEAAQKLSIFGIYGSLGTAYGKDNTIQTRLLKENAESAGMLTKLMAAGKIYLNLKLGALTGGMQNKVGIIDRIKQSILGIKGDNTAITEARKTIDGFNIRSFFEDHISGQERAAREAAGPYADMSDKDFEKHLEKGLTVTA